VLKFMSYTPTTGHSKRQRRFHEIAVAMAWSAEYKERVRLGPLPLTAPLLVLGALLASLLAGCATFEGARLYERGTRALDRGAAAAIADLEHAAELVPQSSEIQNHLGLAHEAAGQDEAALEAFQRAVALDCSNEAAQQNLAAAEARRARLAARAAQATRNEPAPEAP